MFMAYFEINLTFLEFDNHWMWVVYLSLHMVSIYLCSCLIYTNTYVGICLNTIWRKLPREIKASWRDEWLIERLIVSLVLCWNWMFSRLMVSTFCFRKHIIFNYLHTYLIVCGWMVAYCSSRDFIWFYNWCFEVN